MIKYGQFICLMMEEQRIGYKPAEQMQYLKLRIEIDRRSPDYTAYQIKLALEAENEFELCRFNLRKGAQLRDHYKDFSDMDTEYDTVNVLHADWGGLGGGSIAPAITRYFAEIVLENENSLSDDRSFSYLSLSQTGAVPIKVLSDYCSRRTGTSPEDMADSVKLYKSLCIIIDTIRMGKEERSRDKKERHRILVD